MPEIEIKDDPKLKGLVRKITEMGITGVVWGLWAYMLLPILNAVMWIIGVKYFHYSLIEQLDFRELQGLLFSMGWTILAIFIVMRMWGYYNYLRFGKRNRRREAPVDSIENMAEHYKIPVDEIRKMQSEKEIVWYRTD